MKRFKVVNNSICPIDEKGSRISDEMIITLYKPPYEDEDVLSRTKWKLKDCTITDVTPKFEEEE